MATDYPCSSCTNGRCPCPEACHRWADQEDDLIAAAAPFVKFLGITLAGLVAAALIAGPFIT